jgi:single-strand DNA-binding protein
MKNAVNQVQLIGNLGKAPELKTFENGNKVVRFTLATNESYKNNAGEWVNETQWHNLVAWGNLASHISENTEKGSKVIITGKLTNRNYENAKGEKKYITEVVVREIMHMSGSKNNESVKVEENLPF